MRFWTRPTLCDEKFSTNIVLEATNRSAALSDASAPLRIAVPAVMSLMVHSATLTSQLKNGVLPLGYRGLA
jgi:hypothetical protein